MARQIVRATSATATAIVAGGVIRTATATDVARSIVSATRLTDVTRRIVGTPTLAHMAGGIVAATALTHVAGRIVRPAPRHGGARSGDGGDCCCSDERKLEEFLH